MQHTLLPLSERLALHREYHIRLLAVFLFCMSAAIFVGAGALFPAHMRASLAEASAGTAVASEQGSAETSGLSQVEKELSADNALVTILSEGVSPPLFSDAIRSVIAQKGPIVISSFSLSRPATSSISAVIAGLAGSRDGLIAFKDRLQALSPGVSVDLPLEELKVPSNIQFSIRVTIQTP